MTKPKQLSLGSLLIIFIFLSLVLPVHASLVSDLKDKLFGKDPPSKNLSVDGKIELLEDTNKNETTDGGDIVAFNFTLTNPTADMISFASLETNVPRDQVNFIHNIKGTTGLADDGKKITIPNVRIAPGQVLTISFEARLNSFTEREKTISIEPELKDSKQKLLSKAQKKELKIQAISKEHIQSTVKTKEIP